MDDIQSIVPGHDIMLEGRDVGGALNDGNIDDNVFEGDDEEEDDDMLAAAGQVIHRIPPNLRICRKTYSNNNFRLNSSVSTVSLAELIHSCQQGRAETRN